MERKGQVLELKAPLWVEKRWGLFPANKGRVFSCMCRRLLFLTPSVALPSTAAKDDGSAYRRYHDECGDGLQAHGRRVSASKVDGE
jgi:hypothetical protein